MGNVRRSGLSLAALGVVSDMATVRHGSPSRSRLVGTQWSISSGNVARARVAGDEHRLSAAKVVVKADSEVGVPFGGQVERGFGSDIVVWLAGALCG